MGQNAPTDYGPRLISRLQAGSHARAIAEIAAPRDARHRPLLDVDSQPDQAQSRRRDDGTRRLAYTQWCPLVYVVLVEHHNWTTGLCNPGQQTLADILGCAKGTVALAIRLLVAGGWLEIVPYTHQTPHGLRWHHRYVLLPTRRILSAEEQEMILTVRLPRLLRRGTEPLPPALLSAAYPDKVCAEPDSKINKTKKPTKRELVRTLSFEAAKTGFTIEGTAAWEARMIKLIARATRHDCTTRNMIC